MYALEIDVLIDCVNSAVKKEQSFQKTVWLKLVKKEHFEVGKFKHRKLK